jgi:hypothetical protein
LPKLTKRELPNKVLWLSWVVKSPVGRDGLRLGTGKGFGRKKEKDTEGQFSVETKKNAVICWLLCGEVVL